MTAATAPRCPSCGRIMHDLGFGLRCHNVECPANPPPPCEYKVGDTVRHELGLEGIIQEIEPSSKNVWNYRLIVIPDDGERREWWDDEVSRVEPPAPRVPCPACGGAMQRIDNHGAEYWQCHRDRTIVTDAGEAIYALMDKLPYLDLRGGAATVPTPARVPCPACGGNGKVIAEVVGEYEIVNDEAEPHIEIVVCPVCRGRQRVSRELAAAWSADAPQASGGEG